MSTNARIATLATVLTTGLAGLAVTAPMAVAAPTPAPSATSGTDQSAGIGRKLTAPRGGFDPVVVTLTGLKPGVRVYAVTGTYGTEETIDQASGIVGKDGTITLKLSPPRNGWPDGRYTVSVSKEDRSQKYWVTYFRYKNLGTEPSDDSSGGLAKTGQ